MGVRRQIYIHESDDRLLEEKARATGLSVSELIRQAIRQSYGTERKLSWDEVFANPLVVGSGNGGSWRYDPLFDSDLDAEIDSELDSLERVEETASPE